METVNQEIVDQFTQEFVNQFLDDGYDIEELNEAYQNGQISRHESVEDYAKQVYSDQFPDQLSHLINYIDWGRIWKSELRYDYTEYQISPEKGYSDVVLVRGS